MNDNITIEQEIEHLKNRAAVIIDEIRTLHVRRLYQQKVLKDLKSLKQNNDVKMVINSRLNILDNIQYDLRMRKLSLESNRSQTRVLEKIVEND